MNFFKMVFWNVLRKMASICNFFIFSSTDMLVFQLTLGSFTWIHIPAISLEFLSNCLLFIVWWALKSTDTQSSLHIWYLLKSYEQRLSFLSNDKASLAASAKHMSTKFVYLFMFAKSTGCQTGFLRNNKKKNKKKEPTTNQNHR